MAPVNSVANFQSAPTAAPGVASQIAAANNRFNESMLEAYRGMEPSVIQIQEKHPFNVAGELLHAAFNSGYNYYKSWRDYLSGNTPSASATTQQPVAVRPKQSSTRSEATLARARRRNDEEESTPAPLATNSTSLPSSSSSASLAPSTGVTVTSSFTTLTLLPTISHDDFKILKPFYDKLANLYKTSPIYSENPEIANFVDLYSHLNDNFKFGEPLLAERFIELNNAIEQINNVLTTTTTSGPRTTVDHNPWIDTFATYNDIIDNYRMEGKNPEKNSAFSIFRAISYKINDHLTRGTGLTQQEIDAFNNAFFDFQNLPDVAPTLPPVATNSTSASSSSSSQRPTTIPTPSPTVSSKEARLYFNIFSNYNKSFIALGYNSGANYKLFNELFIQAFSSERALTEADVSNLNLAVTNIQKEHSPETTQPPELTPLSNKERNLLLDSIIKNDALIELYLRDHPDGVSQAFKDFQDTHNALKDKLFPLEGGPREIYENESDKYIAQWGIAFNSEIIVKNGTTIIINNNSNGGLNAKGSVGVPFATFIAGLAIGAISALCCCTKSRRNNRVEHREPIYDLAPRITFAEIPQARRAPTDDPHQSPESDAARAAEYLDDHSRGKTPDEAMKRVTDARKDVRPVAAPSSMSGGFSAPQETKGRHSRQAYDVAPVYGQNPSEVLPKRSFPEIPGVPRARVADPSAVRTDSGKGTGYVRGGSTTRGSSLVVTPSRLSDPRPAGSAPVPPFVHSARRSTTGEYESES